MRNHAKLSSAKLMRSGIAIWQGAFPRLHSFPSHLSEMHHEVSEHTSYRDRRVDGQIVRIRQLVLALLPVNRVQGAPREGGTSRLRSLEDGEEFRIAESWHGVSIRRRGAKYPLADVRSAEKLFLFPVAKRGRWDARNTLGWPRRGTRAIRPANRCFIRGCPCKKDRGELSPGSPA